MTDDIQLSSEDLSPEQLAAINRVLDKLEGSKQQPPMVIAHDSDKVRNHPWFIHLKDNPDLTGLEVD
jgi:hypothetical protein